LTTDWPAGQGTARPLSLAEAAEHRRSRSRSGLSWRAWEWRAAASCHSP